MLYCAAFLLHPQAVALVLLYWAEAAQNATLDGLRIGTKNFVCLGHLGGSVVEHLPSAGVVTLGSQNLVPHWAPCMEPVPPSACVSASVSLMNK